MKKTFALMLGFAVLAGCSKVDPLTEGGNGITDNNGLVPIELGFGLNVISKAGVSGSITDQKFTAGIAGWESTENVNYTDNPTWNTTITMTPSTTAAPVTWEEQQYYNADGGKTTYMKAFYPAPEAGLLGTTVEFENNNGDIDVLLAPVVSGNKNNKGSKNLAFAHMTSQLKFVVKAGEGLAPGTKVKKITIKSVQLPNGFDLTKKDAEAVTYATAADFELKGIDTNGIEIPTDSKEVGDPVMIKPTGESTFDVTIETSMATIDGKVTIANSAVMEAGHAYTITLTFKQAAVDITATVAEWQKGEGSADIL